ncbi:hypothetical protein GJ904_19945 [Salmonella enterica]|nr:hypothetical protein [Salmonella enterica subsp. enterica serovar Saintpaul]EEC1303337.1 hypothetical protein [Salmonella enterica]
MSAIIDLSTLTKEEVERVKLEADTNNARMALHLAAISVEKTRAEVDKMVKETRWFPWVNILASALGAAIVSAVITYLMNK